MRIHLVALAAILFVAGCGDGKQPSTGGGGPAAADPFTGSFQSVPLTGAKGVDALKKDGKDGETVVVEGRICDFVEGLAAVNLMDLSLPP